MKYQTILTLAVGFLAACGGGGGSAPGPVASTLSFPLQSAYKARVAGGFSKGFTISGSCTGSGTLSTAPATTPAIFEGVTGLSATSTLTASLANCTPSSLAQSSTHYYSSNYDPRGSSRVGSYGVYLSPLAIPAFVVVGGTGILGTETLYTNSTKTIGNGSIVLSYVIEADTSTTAIVNLIEKNYNASGTLTATEQNRYRIDSVGTLAPTSGDIQSANGSTTHLVLAFN